MCRLEVVVCRVSPRTALRPRVRAPQPPPRLRVQVGEDYVCALDNPDPLALPAPWLGCARQRIVQPRRLCRARLRRSASSWVDLEQVAVSGWAPRSLSPTSAAQRHDVSAAVASELLADDALQVSPQAQAAAAVAAILSTAYFSSAQVDKTSQSDAARRRTCATMPLLLFHSFQVLPTGTQTPLFRWMGVARWVPVGAAGRWIRHVMGWCGAGGRVAERK
jgi:hypothetical protein